MIDKDRVKPMTPGMKMLLEGGGPTSFYKKLVPLKKGVAPKLGNSVEAASVAVPVDPVAAKSVPILGQTQAQGQAPAEIQQVAKCPGPVSLPDGRILEPDDYIQLSDLCEIMPYLMAAMKAAMAPGQQVRVAGGIPGVQGVPSPGMFAGGGPLGPYAQAGIGGGITGGGGAGPRGPTGPAGPAGPAGPSLVIGDVAAGITKVDGDFVVAAGPFVAVPGTTVNFDTDVSGPILVLVQSQLTFSGGGTSVNAQLGLRIDGTDYNLGRRCIDLAGGSAEWMIGQSQMLYAVLAAGSHTLDLLLRGLTAGEYGVGLGTPAAIAADLDSPLQIVVLHA